MLLRMTANVIVVGVIVFMLGDLWKNGENSVCMGIMNFPGYVVDAVKSEATN